MRIPFSLLLPLTLAVLVNAIDIIPALKGANCGAYADWLNEDENIELLKAFRIRNDVTVWCPPDDIVKKKRAETSPATPPKSHRYHRLIKRQGNPGASGTGTHYKPEPRVKRDTNDSSIPPPSNYETLFTFLDSPEFVNLGPGQPGRIVKNLGAQGSAQLKGGRGKVVNQTSGPFRFDTGVIFTIDDFPDLPSTVSDTIQALGVGADFWQAVERKGLANTFDDTPQCTVFVPLVFGENNDPNDQVLCPLLGYTPDLLPGLNYTSLSGLQIQVSYGEQGQRIFNGQALERTDVITKNGVLHVIGEPFSNRTNTA